MCSTQQTNVLSLERWVYPISATLQIEINEIINNLNKRVKYEEPCDGRLSSTVPREGRVKAPPLTRQIFTLFAFVDMIGLEVEI